MKFSFYSFLFSAVLLTVSLLGSNMQIFFQADSGKLASADKKLRPCTWMKDKAETALNGGLTGNINEWNQASFEIIPEKDCMVTLSLQGPFGGSKPLRAATVTI